MNRYPLGRARHCLQYTFELTRRYFVSRLRKGKERLLGTMLYRLCSRCLFALLLGGGFWLPAMAGVAEDVSVPVFKELRFSKDAVAIVTEQGVYRWSRAQGGSIKIDKKVLEDGFPAPNRAMQDAALGLTRWTFRSGDVFESSDGYCQEQAEQFHSLIKKGVPVPTHLPPCDTISALEVVQNQLWLGSYYQGELSRGPGSGVRVSTLKSGELIAAFKPGKDLADGYVQLIQQDPSTGDVWIATNTALHRVRHFKVVERWYVSEQFTDGGLIIYYLGQKLRQSNPWAILVRITGGTDSRAVWRKLQRQPRLAARLHFAYDEEGKFFSLDGVRPGSKKQAIEAAAPSAFEGLLAP